MNYSRVRNALWHSAPAFLFSSGPGISWHRHAVYFLIRPLTQARLWLQSVRYQLFDQVLEGWRIASRNPMSVSQAFMLATCNGGLALRRPDLGLIQIGAKANLVVWNSKHSTSMQGWVDPVAAIILHANVGDVLHVMVDGKFVKKDGRLTDPNFPKVKVGSVESARKIQHTLMNTSYPVVEGTWSLSGYPFAEPWIADTQRGNGIGYDSLFLD